MPDEGLSPENTPPEGETTEEAPSTGYIDIPGVGQVPADEAAKGYMRQSDYTQKTQEVAKEREELELMQSFFTSLDSDPEGTLKALADEYGVEFAQEVREEMEANTDEQTPDPKPEDGLSKDVEELKGFRAQFEEQQLQSQIQAEIRSVSEEFTDSPVPFDEPAVLHHAVANGIPDIRVAYKSWAWEQMHEKGVETGLTQAQEREFASVEGASTGGQQGLPEVDSIEGAWERAKATMRGRKA